MLDDLVLRECVWPDRQVRAAEQKGAILQNNGGTGASKAGKPVKSAAAKDAAARDNAGGSPNFIVREILRGLYRGRFVPGQKLIEADLTRDFGVSRGSVREALNRLAAEGVVTLTLHRGAYIRSLTRAEVVELLSVMEVIVGLAARTAAQRINLPGNRALLDEAYNHLASFK